MPTTRRRILTALALAPVAASAQSGRSWMHGMVFGDSETTGLVGAEVRLTGASDAPQVQGVVLETTTGTDGKYSFSRVPYGDYRFRVAAPAFTPYEIDLYVASDALTQLHVRLKRPSR